jgi:pimeloyl-ACP methyl ester carboxylesterase
MRRKKKKKIGNGAVRILYSVLFCLVSLGFTWVPSPQITTAQAASAFDSAWDALTNVEGLINALPDSAFRNRKNRDALLDKIDATFDQLETGAYTGAKDKLEKNIEKKIAKWIVASQRADLIEALEDTTQALACAEINGMVIPAASIDLPTTGGLVTGTTVVPAAGTGAAATGDYCKVLGQISPVDPLAPNIKFQVDLPASWNHKAMAFGGGGFDGRIPDVAGNVGFGPADQKYPLGRGYATFGSDSGHQAGPLGSQDCLFALNDEALRNFTVEAPKKTRDAAVYIINYYYGRKPKKMHFMGGSTGGREALAAIQRWPADWDGAIALYPAWNDMGALLQGQRIMRAMAEPGAYPDQAQRKVLYDAAMEVCDELDGVADGIISNQKECNAIFDPDVVRCDGSEDTGDTCLSDAQIEALNIYNTPAHFHFRMASGLQSFPGCNVWGADLGMTQADAGGYVLQGYVIFLTLGYFQPALPANQYMPFLSPFMDQFMKYAVVRDPTGTFDTLSIDPENPGPYAHRISELSKELDTSTDISAFVARGGKLLLAHGLQDVLVSTRASEMYWELLQAQFGSKNVKKFARFYEVPGTGHAFGAAFTPGWDSLTALENWVEKGIAPANQIVTDTAVHMGRTRPLCEYPTWPKYKGSGDPDLASSFTCSRERDHDRDWDRNWGRKWDRKWNRGRDRGWGR